MELYVAIAAAVIALCSLAVSIWQGYISRKHARLSVIPDIGIYFSISAYSEFVGIAIENNGLGTARIKSIQISNLEAKGSPETIVSDTSGWKDLLSVFELRNGRVRWASISPGEGIPSGEQHKLIEIPKNDPDLELLQSRLRAMVDSFGIRIEYESMYEEPSVFEWPMDQTGQNPSPYTLIRWIKWVRTHLRIP
ncbi:MAG: hypothetical protein AAGI24_03530 [Pseudomonadota bacterium]